MLVSQLISGIVLISQSIGHQIHEQCKLFSTLDSTLGRSEGGGGGCTPIRFFQSLEKTI